MARRARKARDPELFDVEAGQRMIAFFDRARVELGLATDAELWRKLGVSRDTAQSWMRGERPPSREVGTRVAERLKMSYADLLAVYEGTNAQPMTWGTVALALEWDIQQIRAADVPDEVKESIDRATAHSKARRPDRSPVRPS
jgi:transcriptional regulator with XRE-family HTH domain